VARIVSTVALNESSIHIKGNVDNLLLIIAKFSGSNHFEFLAEIFAIVESEGLPAVRELFLSRELRPRIGFDQPSIREYVEQLILEVQQARTGRHRSPSDRQNLIDYILAAHRVLVDSDFLAALIEEALNGNEEEELAIYSHKCSHLFTDEHIRRVVDCTKPGESLEKRLSALGILRQLAYAGSSVASSTEMIVECIKNTEDIHIRTYKTDLGDSFDATIVLSLLKRAIERNPTLVLDSRINRFIEQHLQRVEEFIRTGENARIYKRSIDSFRAEIARLKEGFPDLVPTSPTLLPRTVSRTIASTA